MDTVGWTGLMDNSAITDRLDEWWTGLTVFGGSIFVLDTPTGSSRPAGMNRLVGTRPQAHTAF
jgi:hypothetical protein